MTLTEFLLARIAEDDADARDHGRHWSECPLPRGGDCTCTDGLRARNRRVLAECEAKRRIVELHKPDRQDSRICGLCERDYSFPCPTLRALALPYADHPLFQPDYQPEWNLSAHDEKVRP